MRCDIGPDFRMTRARLFSLRIGATLGALVLLFATVRLLWFPGGYFQIFGIPKLLLVAAVAAIVAGPVLSTVVYKPGKKGLKSDLVVLAVIEFVIWGWAAYEFSERRPVFAVFAVDRFEAVAATEIDLAQIRYPGLSHWPATAPRLVYAELPTDPEVMSRLIDETVLYGMADIDRRPEFWKPYPQGIAVLKQAAQPLQTLLTSGDTRAPYVRRWLRKQSLLADDFLYLPVQGSRADGTIVLHADIGYPVDVLPIDPW
jgi:hypothetical protein